MSLAEQGYSAEDALAKAFGPFGKRYVRTVTPEDLDDRIGKWLDKYKKINADLIRGGEAPLFRCVLVNAAAKSIVQPVQHATADTQICQFSEPGPLPLFRPLFRPAFLLAWQASERC